jgi:catechol 2,3-dioxygenase-like lactoylglutathione lyase family enzyme
MFSVVLFGEDAGGAAMGARMAYATVGSNDLEAAKAFWDALLEPAGIAPMFDHPSGGKVYGREGEFCFAVLGPYDKGPATVGNGSMIAFNLQSRGEVDVFHAHALELGARDEGAPGFRAPTFYFSYFRDLDGNKVCAFHVG